MTGTWKAGKEMAVQCFVLVLVVVVMLSASI